MGYYANKKWIFPVIIFILIVSSCKQISKGKDDSYMKANKGWQHQVDSLLPLLGHRNWVMIVDKAFPEMTGNMQLINTNDSLLHVLEYVMQKINASKHVSPILYEDKELSFLREDESAGVSDYSKSLKEYLKTYDVTTMLHDSVFSKIKSISNLFNVVVLKTNCTIPYSSVYIELYCKYWDSNKESQLRDDIKNAPKMY